VDCTLIEGDLVPFHFGTLADGARELVEAHLLGCARCLQAFLEVKRAIDKSDRSQPRPSAMLRARLRADVAHQFGRPRRAWRVWGAVAAMVIAGTVVGLYTRRPTDAPAPGPTVQNPEPVDTARLVTAQLRFL
jgi:hypothetical protein